MRERHRQRHRQTDRQTDRQRVSDKERIGSIVNNLHFVKLEILKLEANNAKELVEKKSWTNIALL